MRLFLSAGVMRYQRVYLPYTVQERKKGDIFRYINENVKGHNVTILIYFFQIFLISQFDLQSIQTNAMSDNQQQATTATNVQVEVKETQGK